MKPIVLIHGYSAEGKKRKVEDIYGSLPDDLRTRFGSGGVVEIDLSRWISLSDGIALDDVSFALERSLRSRRFRKLLDSGFHVVIHSTGALVVRNWLRLYGERPSPIANLVHLAGANFGSGLAHIGQGQLIRWGRQIFEGVDSGVRVLSELELGSTKTIELHLHFRESGCRMFEDYQVQEFCMIGSRSADLMQLVPIRYVKEDSADGVVRTSAGNLNFRYAAIVDREAARSISKRKLGNEVEQRLLSEPSNEIWYEFDATLLESEQRGIPFALLFETTHTGKEQGIVSGTDNRDEVLPLIEQAIRTPYDGEVYAQVAADWRGHTQETQRRAAEELEWKPLDWYRQGEYEGHSQLIVRIRDQFGADVEHHDITFKSIEDADRPKAYRLEKMIETVHMNRRNRGTATFYLRTMEFKKRRKRGGQSGVWINRLDNVAPLRFEITGTEPQSEEISYLPLEVTVSPEELARLIQPFETTIVDVTLVRLPSEKVFRLTRT